MVNYSDSSSEDKEATVPEPGELTGEDPEEPGALDMDVDEDGAPLILPTPVSASKRPLLQDSSDNKSENSKKPKLNSDENNAEENDA